MLTSPRDSLSSAHLDVIRGMAALAVFFGHARTLFLVDYTDVLAKNSAVQAFYLLTAMGHEWVMVFFVLSGFFICSTIVRDIERSQWSWARYLRNRGIRLYVVLIPALLITALCDALGANFYGAGPIYEGTALPNLVANVSQRTNSVTFLGNCFFLQTVFVTPFGSNGPLWSLANEFWYYLLFPAMLIPFTGVRSIPSKFACLLTVLVIATAGWNLMPLFPVWLLGTALVAMPVCLPLRNRLTRRYVLGLAAAIFGIFMVAAQTRFIDSSLVSDYCVGLSFSVVMYVILHDSEPCQVAWYAWCARQLARCSYSLYLVHLPVLICIAAACAGGARWQPNGPHAAIYFGICIGVFLFAYCVALLTEARTDEIRKLLFSGRRSTLIDPAQSNTERDTIGTT